MSSPAIAQSFELALQHHQSGRLTEAETIYRQILSEQPSHGDALHLLGVVFHQRGQHRLAQEWISRAIEAHPANAAAHSNLGEAYRATGRLDDAIACYRHALELQPNLANALNNMGEALRAMGRLDEAIAAFQGSLSIQPYFAPGYNNLGIALSATGRLEESIATYHQALAMRPDYAEAWNNLGISLAALGRLHESVAAYQRALQISPEYANAHSNLAHVFWEQGLLDDAIAASRRAITLKPNLTAAHMNLGNALKDLGLLDEALAAFRHAIEMGSDYTEGQNDLAHGPEHRGELDESIAEYHREQRSDPNLAVVSSNLIYALHLQPGLDPQVIAAEQGRWNEQFCDPVKQFARAHTNERNPDRRLRVGYVSPDFRAHALGRNILPLLEHHEHQDFEIVCYSGVSKDDALTEKFRGIADHWRCIVGMSDEALAELIRRDKVDILVDLSQHSAGNRLPVFARRPAPVQVSFAGYPASAGVDAIPYRISDRYLEANESTNASADRAEQVFLIESFWCYAPQVDAPTTALSAVKSGAVTFGCLSNFCKINEPVLQLWAKILNATPASRLVLLTPEGNSRQRVHEILARYGIERDRTVFVGRCSHLAYLERYRELDIVLDPFPYNGHTTTLDALWMGVPVVSLAGAAPVARAGLSILTNLGLTELIASSEEDYFKIAVRLARDLPRLAERRHDLRSQLEASLLMDGPRFARNIEVAYRTMWRQWCVESPSLRI